MNDILKLPKWAQDRIVKLRNEVDTLRSQLRAVNELDTPIVWQYYLDDKIVGIPEDSIILFKLRKDQGISVRLERGGLVIYSTLGRIKVIPQASNSVRIEPDVKIE